MDPKEAPSELEMAAALYASATSPAVAAEKLRELAIEIDGPTPGSN